MVKRRYFHFEREVVTGMIQRWAVPKIDPFGGDRLSRLDLARRGTSWLSAPLWRRETAIFECAFESRVLRGGSCRQQKSRLGGGW
jgi:hypothetical protein